jgi:hypothetical protein
MKRVAEDIQESEDVKRIKPLGIPQGFEVQTEELLKPTPECHLDRLTFGTDVTGFVWRQQTKDGFKVFYTMQVPIWNQHSDLELAGPMEFKNTDDSDSDEDAVYDDDFLHTDNFKLQYDATLGGYRSNNPCVVVFPLNPKKCDCVIVSEHPKQLSETEQDNEMANSKTAHDREWNAHTEVYTSAWSNFSDAISGNNCETGERMMMRWERDNHGLLCCELRHANQSLMFDY